MAAMLSATSDQGKVIVAFHSVHQRHMYRHIKCRNKRDKYAQSKGKAMPPHAGSFQNDLFKLTPELRNQIYEYVLHGELQYESEDRWGRTSNLEEDVQQLEPRYIKSGNDNEPALFEACRQVRSEAPGIYYRINAFVIDANIYQMAGVNNWLSSIRKRYEDPLQLARLTFLDLGLSLRKTRWNDLRFLGPLARLAQVHCDYFKVDLDLDVSDGNYIKSPENIMCDHRRLLDTALGVIKLGNKAVLNDWHEEWLRIRFEAWLKKKVAGNTGDKQAIKRLGRKAALRIKEGLPGDQLANGTRDTEKSRAPSFARCKQRDIGTSDRTLRYQTKLLVEMDAGD